VPSNDYCEPVHSPSLVDGGKSEPAGRFDSTSDVSINGPLAKCGSDKVFLAGPGKLVDPSLVTVVVACNKMS
jgi:hypothetical protein